jgi:hypothetical protein
MSIQTAFEDCQSYQVNLKKDWFQLSTEEKSYFIDLAKSHHYKDPKHPSGRSRGYCFYLGLQRKQSQWNK